MRLLFCLLSIGFFAACSSKVTPTGSTTKSTGAYSEDLSALRPKLSVTKDTVKQTATTGNNDQTVERKFTVNKQLDVVLDSIDRINVSNNYVDGFTIQVYSGVKREDALNTKKLISTSLPDVNAEIQYVQPNFRVRAGKYLSRLEAQKDYLAVKKHFPNAILIPERIIYH